MPFNAYGGARPSAGLEHVCSCLFNEMVIQSSSDRVATKAIKYATKHNKVICTMCHGVRLALLIPKQFLF